MAEERSVVADLSDSDTGDDSKITETSGKTAKDADVSKDRNRGDNPGKGSGIQSVKVQKENNHGSSDHANKNGKPNVKECLSGEKPAAKMKGKSLEDADERQSNQNARGKNQPDGFTKDLGVQRTNEKGSSKDADDCQSEKDTDLQSNTGKISEMMNDSSVDNRGNISHPDCSLLEEDSGENDYVQQSSGYVDDWQSGKDFIQTNLMMLDSETLTDVTFKVGEEGEIIRSHRFMLASRSCVFFAMFCGQMAETSEIRIDDIDPNAFRNLLRYLYTGVMALTADNALTLLYCSKKYCVKSLEQEVLEYCKSSICADNACVLLEQACLYSEVGLQEAAFTVIKKDPELVFASEGFPKLSHTNLDKLLDMDDLAAEEEVVFQAVLVWAREECKRQGKEAEMSNIRELLGDSLYKIRFPLMTQSEFVTLVGTKGILTDSERVRILESYISPTSPTDPFLRRPRTTGAQVYKIQRLVHGGVGYSLSRGTDAIYISCNKSVKLLGVMLYCPANISTSAFSFFKSLLDSQNVVPGDSTTFYITIVVRNASNVRIGIHHEDVNVTSQDTQLEVMLSSPVQLASDEKFTLAVLIEGSVRCWGVMNGMPRLTDPAGDVTWSFGHARTKSGFDDSLKEGYISGLIYSLDK